jgi:DNA topoisomerase-1
MPEDITLNISKSAAIPRCPIDGRCWGSVVHRKDAFWIATWIEEITGGRKYVSFAGSSKVKAESDI